jgi:hypothetical protein
LIFGLIFILSKIYFTEIFDGPVGAPPGRPERLYGPNQQRNLAQFKPNTSFRPAIALLNWARFDLSGKADLIPNRIHFFKGYAQKIFSVFASFGPLPAPPDGLFHYARPRQPGA